MRKSIYSGSKIPVLPTEYYNGQISKVHYNLSQSLNRDSLEIAVKENEIIKKGDLIARGKKTNLHSSISGKVLKSNENEIIILNTNENKLIIENSHTNQDQSKLNVENSHTNQDQTNLKTDNNLQNSENNKLVIESSKVNIENNLILQEQLPEFALNMGLVGMGGSMFPYSIKFGACKKIHTIIINSVECEPLIEIDEALLLNRYEYIFEGVEFLKKIFKIKNILLAIKSESKSNIEDKLKNYEFSYIKMNNYYPAGAERLIIQKVIGKTPSSRKLPFHFGCLVSSVASLYAIGRRIKEGMPSIERPLTLYSQESGCKNVIVPLGITVNELLRNYNIDYDKNKHIIIAGGKMMGSQVFESFPINKGTNAILVIEPDKRLKKAEEVCILCGACYDACPLGLHPSKMVDKLKEGDITNSLKIYLTECFLCGACSAVCPSEIPLVHYFKEGKKWLK